MKKTNSSSTLEDRVKNYGDEIKQISDFVEQVRQTPDVYIGKVYENAAFLTMVREIFQNSIDEILKGNAFSPDVYITYDERTHQVIVSDNGRGIPHGKIGIIFGTSHTSSNYVKEPYKYSAGKNGCGGSTTNALSSKFTVDSYVLGKAKHAEFIEGHLWKKGEVDIKCGDKQGTVISFIPNETVIGPVTSTWKDVYDLIALIVPSTPIGTHVEFTGIDAGGKQHIESIDNRDGIIAHLINMTQTPFIEPIVITNDDGTRKMEVAFTYDTGSDEQIISLNNTCPTDGGKHVDGAIDGITKYFRDYMNKIYLSNSKSKTKLTCTSNDIRQGLKLAVNTFHLTALYNGQAKEILSNDDMKPFVSQTIIAGLTEWSKTHSAELQKLCKYFKEVIELRCKQDKDKVKLSAMFEASSLSGLPQKYLKPNSRHGTELIIVEGDSAFGAARNVRDQSHQGIFPSRGKIPNVFEKSKAEVLKNEELSGVLHIMDAGYGKSFNLAKCKVDKVIIMADADPDGAHIRTLWLRFFMMYCAPLVEAGRLYAALPPLYAIPQGKGYKYFGTNLDFIKYVQKEFCKNFVIKSDKGTKLTTSEVTKLLYNNSDYVTEIQKISANHAIDPYLLEDILVNRKLPFAKFKTTLQKKYRFLKIDKSADTIILDGIANEKYHKAFINSMLISECAGVMKYIDASKHEYYLNDVLVSLYTIMNTFEEFKPPKLTRFKGLGEMNPDMLGLSTLRPDGDRTLVRYDIESIDRELDEMRYINSNKDLLLKD
jgi:DNA gyrase/topoisomerase IV subunit B